MLELLLLVLGLALGALAVFWWSRGREERLRVAWEMREAELRAEHETGLAALRAEVGQARAAEAEARQMLARAETELEAERRAARDEAEQHRQMEQAFAAHAAKAGDELVKRFLDVAGTKLGATEKSNVEALEARKAAIEQLMKPLAERLGKLDELTRDLEGRRKQAYGQLGQQLTELKTAVGDVHASSRSLSDALRGSSQARGRWGEIALHNIVEMAGMTRHVDFHEQSQDSSGNRPDMVVRLPGGDMIPVDAKTLWKDFEAACTATDPAAREASLASHVARVREVVKALKKKDYAGAVDGRVDFTVMFVPSEAVVAAAFTHDPRIFEWALDQSVLIATPATLMALLRTVSLYWREDEVAENSRELWELALEYHKRTVVMFKHLQKVGDGLGRTSDHFNKAVGSFSRMVLPQGRKLEEKATAMDADKRLPELELLDRPLASLPGYPVAALPSSTDLRAAEAEDLDPADEVVAEEPDDDAAPGGRRAGTTFRSRLGPAAVDDPTRD